MATKVIEVEPVYSVWDQTKGGPVNIKFDRGSKKEEQTPERYDSVKAAIEAKHRAAQTMVGLGLTALGLGACLELGGIITTFQAIRADQWDILRLLSGGLTIATGLIIPINAFVSLSRSKHSSEDEQALRDYQKAQSLGIDITK